MSWGLTCSTYNQSQTISRRGWLAHHGQLHCLEFDLCFRHELLDKLIHDYTTAEALMIVELVEVGLGLLVLLGLHIITRLGRIHQEINALCLE